VDEEHLIVVEMMDVMVIMIWLQWSGSWSHKIHNCPGPWPVLTLNN
jgi:hypothetical protein